MSERLTVDDRGELLRLMLMMRGVEERAMTLYRQGKVPGSFYDGRGQEAIPVGVAFALAPTDRVCPLHRDLGVHLARGTEPARILAQYMGRDGGVTGGRDANVHFGEAPRGCVAMVSMLGSMTTVAAGLALAARLRDQPRCAVTWIGDGGTSTGAFHEAMNFAGVRKLPLIVVVENNGFAYSTSTADQYAVAPAERAEAYGFAGVEVDGNDCEAMFEATRIARERALAGEGPTMLEAVTMRMHGHAAHDDMSYVPKEQIEEWRAKDPIERQVARLEKLGVDVQAIRDDVAGAIEQAAQEALAMPMPDLEGDWDAVFCTEAEVSLGDEATATWSGFVEAVK